MYYNIRDLASQLLILGSIAFFESLLLMVIITIIYIPYYLIFGG